QIASEEESHEQLDVSIFSGNLRLDDLDNARDCYTLSDGNNFKVCSNNFFLDKSKAPGGKPLLELVAANLFKDTKRMDNVARRSGCAAQVASERGHFSIIFNLHVPGSTHYSKVFYFVPKEFVPGSLMQRFVDGYDDFQNCRLELIPSVPKGSWIVRQSIGSTACLLRKSIDFNYIRRHNYLEIDVDIGSSTVTKGVLGLVIGVITTVVVDIAKIIISFSSK
ncbi:protein enhanced disease resistance 2, partial [Phtheirospermum japonicum]